MRTRLFSGRRELHSCRLLQNASTKSSSVTRGSEGNSTIAALYFLVYVCVHAVYLLFCNCCYYSMEQWRLDCSANLKKNCSLNCILWQFFFFFTNAYARALPFDSPPCTPICLTSTVSFISLRHCFNTFLAFISISHICHGLQSKLHACYFFFLFLFPDSFGLIRKACCRWTRASQLLPEFLSDVKKTAEAVAAVDSTFSYLSQAHGINVMGYARCGDLILMKAKRKCTRMLCNVGAHLENKVIE